MPGSQRLRPSRLRCAPRARRLSCPPPASRLDGTLSLARDQARAKAAADAGKATQTARNWAERNVAGAKDEKDAELIRGMNEFLQ